MFIIHHSPPSFVDRKNVIRPSSVFMSVVQTCSLTYLPSVECDSFLKADLTGRHTEAKSEEAVADVSSFDRPLISAVLDFIPSDFLYITPFAF